ncbi:MAG: GMC oxidoreductase [Myxococcales bacterium]|nr:GMC oxidoreductase [Polyangiaceae bacterium]MDW8248266.1 GMC oxidoreductase [Myxococcales bacterium]
MTTLLQDHGTERWDFVIIGSGFGGSVSALRLTEKGYRVLVIEKGRRFRKEDFPRSNWDVRRWLWKPELGFRGIFQMSFFEHVTVLHGVGVGGGSLVYANTLPLPKDDFFQKGSWAGLADWKNELSRHYATARAMLGAAPNPRLTRGDRILKEIAEDIGRSEHWEPTHVAVFFGEPNKEVPDPYFGGEGPPRVGCNFCGACMTGCRVGAKNTLDQNYLYLAERRGARILPETEVLHVRPRGADDGSDGYQIQARGPDGMRTIEADQVIFAGGVMGTVPLLLRMKEDPRGLPRLSPRVGDMIRTNNEALIGVISPNPKDDFSKGVAITSILHTDEVSHIEPVRYAEGSGFFRMLALPHAPGNNILVRAGGAIRSFVRQPLIWLKALTVPDFARQSQVLLYMRTLEGTLRMRLGRSVFTGMTRNIVSELDPGTPAPTAFMKEATDLAERFARKVGGVTMTLLTETLLGTPTTAHILGGACMGQDADHGVIDTQHRVFHYKGLYVIDGSAVSANPGVNPSLTITALAERAMSFIPARSMHT